MMKSPGKSFLLFCTFLAFSEVSCRLTVKAKDVEAKVGSTAFLNCSSNDTSRQDIDWFHYGVGDPERQIVYQRKSLEYPYNERFRMEINPATGAFNVVILKVEASDAGRYLCWEKEENGEFSEAQLVVLDSDPICDSGNIKLDQLIGENSCGLETDAVELKCSAFNYRGNRAPQLKWRRVDRRPDEAPAQRINPTDGVTSMVLTASVELSGASFVCEAQNSVSPGLISSSSPIARVLHALENRTEIHVTQNDVVLCEANTNCQSCSYAWYDDRGQQVSSTQNMTARRLGSHHCKAKCLMRNKECEIVAKQIYVIPPDPLPLPPPDPILWLLTLLVFVVFAAVLILVFFLYKRHKERITDQIAELKKNLYARHPEMIAYRDNPIQMPSIPGKSSSSSSSSSPNDQQQLQCKIRGVTVLGESVFVVYLKTREIRELDSLSYEEKRFIAVPDLVDPWDIASSPSDNCLYVMDGKTEQDNKEIIQIDPNGKVRHSWTTKKDAGYLSVTAEEGNVILAVFKKNLLKEFDSEGNFLRKIRVSATGGRIIHPHHAFKLVTTKHYVLIHGVGDSLHRVCIVDKHGSTIKTFGGRKGCADAQMNLPKYMVVDRSGSVMVLDQNNNRVLLLNFDLGFQKVLIAPNMGLANPSKIHLDETNGRLLIAEDDCIRVFSVRQMAAGPLDMV